MPPRRLLFPTVIRRRYTTLGGVLRYHWTGDRVQAGKPTIYGHRWVDVLHEVNGQTHDFEGFGVPTWMRFTGSWHLVWPCLSCGVLTDDPARHRCDP